MVLKHAHEKKITHLTDANTLTLLKLRICLHSQSQLDCRLADFRALREERSSAPSSGDGDGGGLALPLWRHTEEEQ